MSVSFSLFFSVKLARGETIQTENHLGTQLNFFPEASSENASTDSKKRTSRSGTFIDNMKLPIHRWFRYSAGFSAEWVSEEVRSAVEERGATTFLDPFAGSGTAPLAAASEGIKSYGFESHPFVYRIARAKLAMCGDTNEFRELASEVLADAKSSKRRKPRNESPLMAKCYSPEALVRLEAIRDAYCLARSRVSRFGSLFGWL